MEVVFLIEGTSARRQRERRAIAIVRHTETGLDVLDCATIGDVGAAAAGEAVDQEVLSARVQTDQSKLDPHEIKEEG